MAAKRALLIGPSYSPDLPLDICGPLDGTQNDVRLMKDMLCKSGFQSEDIETLLGDEASRDKILSSLEKLSFTAEKGSVVVIYFSGHGYQLTHEYDQGLLPAGLTRQMVDKYHIYDMCITGEHLKPHLLRLIQKDCLVNTIFDCCFSGRLYRGYGTKEGPTPKPKMLKLSDEYIKKYCEILQSGSAKHLKQPTEQCDDHALSVTGSLSTGAVPSAQLGQESTEPKEYEPRQETQPPNPMQLATQLKHPVQEFWNRMLKAQGWKPSQHDKFIHIAASATNQKAFEVMGQGCLTLALVEAIDEARQENKKISYSILKSLIKRKFVEKEWTDQTPQFEGGKMDLMLFSTFDTVPQVNAFDIVEVKRVQGFYKVSLNAGHLHGVVEGEYDVCRPEIPDETAASRNREKVYGYYIDTIVINRGDIDMLKSRGATPYKYDRDIRVGCKAILCRRHSMFTPVLIVAPPELSEEDKHRMDLSLETQNMFNIETEERPHCVTLDIKIVEDKQCWRACQYGRMIVPYHLAGDEHLMAKNLSKYFRHKFALKPKHANDNMLTKVSFKVFKVENVPSFKGSPDKKNGLIANAIKTPDLSGGDPPTFRAHKVELENSLAYRRRYKVIDGSGDALVIQVTNNEDRYIHVCVISYQADGSIVVLHPPRKGNTEVLEPTESMTCIKRVLLEPDTVRRMVEPDFDKERPKCCKDVMILYATTEPADYEPLTQTAIELSPKLSTRGPNQPDGLLLASSFQFRNALHPPRDYLQPARDSHQKWLTIKREINLEYNDDP